MLWLNDFFIELHKKFFLRFYSYSSKYFYRVFGTVYFFAFHFSYAQPCSSKETLVKAIDKYIINNKRGNQLKNLEILNSQFLKCKYAKDSSYIKLLKNLASSYLFLDRHDSAYKLITKAIFLNGTDSQKFNEKDFSDLYYYLGLLEYTWKINYNSSLSALNKAVFWGLKSKSFDGKWKYSYDLQSRIYHKHGDYWQSINKDKQIEVIARLEKDTLSIAQALAHQALNYTDLGDLYNAEIKLKEAIKIARTLGNNFYDLASYYHRLAEIQRKTNKIYPSLKNYQKSISISKIYQEEEGVAESNASIGFLYSNHIKNYSKADYFYKIALRVAKEPYLNVRILTQMAGSYKLRKDFVKSLATYKIAITTIQQFLGERELSAKIIQKAAYKEYILTLIQDKADTWLDYYKATKTKSHLTGALKTYALADSMIDFMRYEHAGEGSKLFWRQKTRGMYERAIEASYLAGDTEQAFRFFEKSKAVLLADKLNELGANQQLPEADAKRQRSLRDSIANLQNQLAALPANDKKRQTLQTNLEAFNDDFETFRKNIEETNPAYYRYKYDNNTPSINEFKKHLSLNIEENNAFISYFVGDSVVYAFTLTAQQSKLVKLKITPLVYQSTANEFLTLCANRAALNAHYPRYRALAYVLYEQLWKPLNITSKHVIISSDGVFLPFEALITTPEGNEFLLKRHAISYTYSANFLVKDHSLRQSNKILSRSFLGFAPETFVNSLKQAPLNGSTETLFAVSQGFWFGKNLTQEEATKANFMRYAPNARVIQLFTHADADSTNDGEPKIYFQDAVLRLSELNHADRFDAQLLVLSACKTGIGQNQRGEGVFSLARGFATLGIPSTLTTLWNIEDQPTYELTKLFYKHLGQGLSKDEALQHAKLDWLDKGGAADALPSQWAGMILVGDTEPLSGLPFEVYGLVVLSLVLLLRVWWWKKRKTAAL